MFGMIEASINVDERIAIHVARFDQCDRRIGMFGEITRDDAARGARANNDNIVGFLGHQCLSLSRHLYRSINTRSWRNAVAVPDTEIMDQLLENDLATPTREITSRHRIDRRSLLPPAARRDAVALFRDIERPVLARSGRGSFAPVQKKLI
jgi:hypothetical protein